MKTFSALFLILLIAPFTIASKDDVLELIQNSAEGKEVLKNIFMEVSMQGATLKVASVRAALRSMDSYVRSSKKSRHAFLGKAKTTCKSDLHSLKTAFHDLTMRALAVDRALTVTKRRTKRRGVFLSRANQELDNYRTFRSMMASNSKGWNSFYAAAVKNLRKVVSLLDQAAEQIKTHAALIELPESYHVAFTEINSSFENTSDNLGGLRPVISNLLSLVSQKASKAELRERASQLMAHLADNLGDKINELEEENSHQVGLFESLNDLFGDAISRGEKVTASLKSASKNSEKRVSWLKGAVKGAQDLAKQARSVVDNRAQECRSTVNLIIRQNIKSERFLGVVNELQGVIADRWGAFHGFFLQKIQEMEEKH
jgi:hypothetical protein